MRLSRGFTLLEVLIAISIFAIIGLGANQMLRTVMTTHDRARQVTDEFGALTRAFMLIERDIAQIVPRGVRDEYGEPLPPVMVGTGPYLLEFTRTGWNNPLALPRSNEQRVAYELDGDGQLVRYIWLVLDRAEDSEPYRQVLLTGLSDFRVSTLGETGTASGAWPDLDSRSLLPVAIEVVIATDAMGELRRVVPLVSEVRVRAGENGGTPGDENGDDVGNTEIITL